MKRTVTILLTLLVALAAASSAQYRIMEKSDPVDDSFTELPKIEKKAPLGRSSFTLPPGTVLDSSYYDWQRNGSLNKRIWVNADGSIHATYMVSPDEQQVERGMKYYYADQFGSAFSPGTEIASFRDGFGSISAYPTSAPNGAVAVVSTHDFAAFASYTFTDAYQGLGAFSELTTNDADQVLWPKPSVNSDGSISIAGTLNNNLTVNGIAHNVAWDRAPDITTGFSQTWTFLGEDPARWSETNMEYPTLASGPGGRVAIVIADFAADVHFYESTDNGISFAETLITTAATDTFGLPTDPDSSATVFLPYLNCDMVYVDEEPHIVWTALQGAQAAGVGLYDYGTRIYHWSPSTGTNTVTISQYQSAVPSEAGYVFPGANHATIDWPQIGTSPDGNVLYMVYVAFNSDDTTAVSGIGYGDIFGTLSVDNGVTWTDPVNLTNPGGLYPGADDRYPSISPINYETAIAPGNDFCVVYQTDDTGGSVVQSEESVNLDFFLFLPVDLEEPSGIGKGGTETGSLPKAFALHQNYPNPFNPATTVKYEVPEGTKKVVLSVYDSRGRLVNTLISGQMDPGVHQLTWDGKTSTGEATASGIYFLRMKSDTVSQTIKMVMMK